MSDALQGVGPLLVFAKWPQPGQVKTRLCPPLGHAQAAALYQSFLLDLVRRLERRGLPVIVAVHPAAAVPAFRAMVPASFAVVPQLGADLGERMAGAFQSVLLHAPLAVLMGSDIPHLPHATLERAFAQLGDDTADVVLCPDRGGGYCLVGMRAPARPQLFLNLPMSVASNYQRTRERCAQLGLRVAELEPCFDIDCGEDLRQLAALIAADAELRDELPETRRSLQELGWL